MIFKIIGAIFAIAFGVSAGMLWSVGDEAFIIGIFGFFIFTIGWFQDNN